MNTAPVTLFQFVEHWKNEGYGIALVDKETDVVVAPYVEPDDYPTLMFTSLNNGGSSICGKYYLTFHSGCLEEDKNFLVKQILNIKTLDYFCESVRLSS